MSEAPVHGVRSTENLSLTTRFAFDGRVGEVLKDYFQRDAQQARLSKKFKLYYRLRPFVPVSMRQLMQRSRNRDIRVRQNWYLPIEFLNELREAVQAGPDAATIHPWPDGFHMAASLTHDVETAFGVAYVDRLAAMEERFGLRSAWNFIPYKYSVDKGLLRDLRQRGHEIGVHGYNHDGRLFESKQTFDHRSGPINRAIANYGSSGFRAPMVHRNLEWLQALNIDYDASCFDVDPFQAMPGGVGGVWPFFAGKFVELPYTLPQDHTLLVTLGETTPSIWFKKLAALRQLAGMAMLVTHPDYLNTQKRLSTYQRFLEHLVEHSDCWKALPHQIATWWRQRDRLEMIGHDRSAQLVGPVCKRARIVTLGDLFQGNTETLREPIP